jgi:FMN reductase
MMRRLVMVSAGLSVPSSTRLLADRLVDAVVSATEARGTSLEIEHVELRPLAHQLADHLLTGFASGDLADAIAKVRRADGLVVVTPVFAASYSGLFKTFVDVLEPGTLDGKPVLIAATGGTARHSMVLDHTLRPLFAHLRAVVVPTGVFAASEDFGNTDEGHLDKRVRRAAGELAALMGVDAGPANQPITDDRRSVEDPFENPTPFDELLRRASER